MMLARANSNDGRLYPDLLTSQQWTEVGEGFGLTGRELASIRLMARGLGNGAIADRLGIRLPTVRAHLRAAYTKLACAGRVDVILHLVHSYR